MRLILLTSLLSRLQSSDFISLRRNEVFKVVSDYFPLGLFGFYMWERDEILRSLGAKGAEFAYDVLWRGSKFDFVEYFRDFTGNDVWDRLELTLAVSIIVFGNDDVRGLPAQELYDQYISKSQEVTWKISYHLQHEFRDRRFSEQWPDIAKGLLAEIDKLNLMLRIREGKFRIPGIKSQQDQAIDPELVQELRRYLG
jgi:hypothetical protein